VAFSASAQEFTSRQSWQGMGQVHALGTFDFVFETPIPVAWPQGDHFLDGGWWQTGPGPSNHWGKERPAVVPSLLGLSWLWLDSLIAEQSFFYYWYLFFYGWKFHGMIKSSQV
jgi:hypothetical protein